MIKKDLLIIALVVITFCLIGGAWGAHDAGFLR